MLKPLIYLLTTSLFALFLTACGQKGPLYLPTPEPQKTHQRGA